MCNHRHDQWSPVLSFFNYALISIRRGPIFDMIKLKERKRERERKVFASNISWEWDCIIVSNAWMLKIVISNLSGRYRRLWMLIMKRLLFWLLTFFLLLLLHFHLEFIFIKEICSLDNNFKNHIHLWTEASWMTWEYRLYCIKFYGQKMLVNRAVRR
jgi:hypothetical protein